MATDLKENLRVYLSDPDNIENNEFNIVQGLSFLLNSIDERSYEFQEAQELLLRALEHRNHFTYTYEILNDLVRKVGLYPYLNPKDLNLRDLLAYEIHRPDNFDSEIVFHKIQAKIYHHLLNGENVILSAPTSFGKSLIIDAIIATSKYQNIVIVVPTIALIDETRRRLFSRFKNDFKIITHPTQKVAEKNIFVLTQERVVDTRSFPEIDLFVIDEFYKLDPREDSDRSNILNQAFYKLWKTGGQFYLLGPNIKSIPETFEGHFDCKFIDTDYSTVVTEVHKIKVDESKRPDVLVNIVSDFEEPTLIYCQSPASTNKVAKLLLESEIGTENEALSDAYDWVVKEFHPDWIVAEGLKKGIGIHHGRIPRALAQYLVRAFNNGLLDFLICTSTLIEGVNTAAKNVVIYDHKLSTKNLDYFTFNNIKGRSGRMFEHFIGRVYVFKDPPEEELPFVDVPLLNQDESPESLLIHLEEEDLSENSKVKLDDLFENSILPVDILKTNNGVDPSQQINLAEDIIENLNSYYSNLTWNGFPEYKQLELVCVLIWDYLVKSERYRAGVSSGNQLCFKIWRFYNNPSLRSLINAELEDGQEPTEAVENALHFVRYWVTYHFPRLLMTVDTIQKYIIREDAGDYSLFASSIENFFQPPGAGELEEYGIPIQVSKKLLPSLQPAEDFDEVLYKIGSRDLLDIELHPFEEELVNDALNYLR